MSSSTESVGQAEPSPPLTCQGISSAERSGLRTAYVEPRHVSISSHFPRNYISSSFLALHNVGAGSRRWYGEEAWHPRKVHVQVSTG